MSKWSSPDSAIESEWLQALKQGDRNAFTQLYDFYWQRLFTVAYNYTRSRETAQELVQEVFMSLWVKREELVVRTNLESYLYGAIRFRLYDLLDKQKSASLYADYAAYTQTAAEETTEQQLAFAETTALIQQQIDTFPETTRQVFLLSRFEGLSVAQIAENLHLSPKAIEYHITKALRLLRLHLTDICLLLLYMGCM
ncbi:RNA polymerase sigma-70 factor [Larkinella rosea]|uniref:RNA polymerase sigma-70 factor n=1 Tax=Larkinella rosea TaxID=2025312 RepID=A0A3P1BAI2_9BACT|nr:RNA polymerase sigma-70 factor [Larkinella rosea]RRA98136.1 RNA polymerase sigma-70 factor [Larkinella rosea]